jgi:hypothetical protein
MRWGVVLVGFVSFLASMFGVVYFLRDGNQATRSLVPPDLGAHVASDDEDKTKTPERPKINTEKGAPQPKAVIEETTFAFGGMQLGEERDHTFVIRNEGQAPLAVVVGPTTCQCTVGNVSKDQVEPGESAEVKLTWKPTAETDEFDKGAEIWTNDPDHETIKLNIKGIVAARLRIYPGYTWSDMQSREGGSTELTGMILSPISENFTITGFECENPHASAEATKIEDADRLKELEVMSGYIVKVTLQPEMTFGGFSFPLTIKTDLKDAAGVPSDVKVTIRGSRSGPFRIVGPEWFAEIGTIALGTFDAVTGRSVTVKAVALQPPPEGLKVNEADVVCDPKELKVRIVPDESKPGSGRFLLTVEYPPGAPRTVRREEQPARVRIRTNHPKSPEFEFMVYFAAN